MPEAVLANDLAARTETGEIKNQTSVTSLTTTEKPTTETKTETKQPETKTETATDSKSVLNTGDKPAGAPEAYTDFTVPEGFTLDPEVAKEAGELFKGMNLSQEQGQQLVNFYTAKTLEAFNAPFEAYRDMTAKWAKDVAADAEVGGKLDEVRRTVGQALDSLGDPALTKEFRELMDLTGAGSHPAFVKVFFRMAKMLGEGRHVGGGVSPHGQQRSGTASRPSAASALFPNLPSSA